MYNIYYHTKEVWHFTSFTSFFCRHMKITQDLVCEFLQFYKNKNFKQNTLDNYNSDFKDFLKFVQASNWTRDIEVNQINLKLIEDFRSALGKKTVPKQSIYYWKRSTLAPRTIQSKIQAVKQFLKFCNFIYEQWMDYNRIETPKIYSKPMDFLEEIEVKRLIEHVDHSEQYEINRLRSKLFITMWFTTGMRLWELLSVKVDEALQESITIVWKWDRERIVFITDEVRRLLLQYLSIRERELPRTGKKPKNNSESNYVFISHQDITFWNPISKQTVCWIFKKYNSELQREKKITAHVLRHSFATHLLRQWIDLRQIQEFLGHSDITTTQRYTHIVNSQLEATHKAIFWQL